MKMYWLSMAFCLSVTGCATTPTITPLKSDPHWVSAQLDNGLRYHIYPDTEKNVSIRLIVHAGSAHETQNQKGYAHFVEHMAFNGSEHFSQNDVIALFERAGLTFGPDINAYTSYEETVYKLDLPDHSQLNSALTWMRDIGDGIQLAPEEVAKEKNVIMGEFRHSRLENKTIAMQFYDHMIANTDFISNDPLGTKASVQSASAEGLSSFYQTWYQPQLVELVITGDVTLEKATQLVEHHFSTWEKGASISTPIDNVVLNNTDFVGHVTEGESPSIAMLIDRGSSIVDTQEQQHQVWLDDIAHTVIQQRLNTAYLDAAMPIQWSYAMNFFIADQRYSLSSIAFPTQYREQGQKIYLDVLASVRDHGIAPSEMDNVLKPYQYQLEHIEANKERLNAVDHAENRVMSALNQQIIQSDLDYKASLTVFLAQTDREAINNNIDELLSSPYLFALGIDDSKSISDITKGLPKLTSYYAKKGKKPLLNNTSAAFAAPTVTGSILSETPLSEEPNITRWELDNGIDVLYLRDSNAGDDVALSLVSKGGVAALDDRLLPAANIAIPVVSRSGIGGLNGAQLNAHLRTYDIELYPFINMTHHGVEVLVDNENIAEGFAVLLATMTDINVDTAQLNAVKEEFIQNRNAYLKTAKGKFDATISHNVYAPHSRYWLEEASSINNVSVEQIREIHDVLFQQHRNDQLVIVADINPIELKPLVRQYVAGLSLSPAKPVNYAVQYNDDFKSKVTLAENTENHSHYMTNFVSGESNPITSGKTLFMQDMIQRLLTKRLMFHVREELSLDYNPYVWPARSDGELKSNWVVSAIIDPHNAKAIEQAINDVITSVLQGVSEEEVHSAAKQLVVGLEPMKDSLSQQAWLYNRYTIHGYGIDALLSMEKTANSITVSDMNLEIQRAFGTGARQSQYLLMPKK